MSDYFAVVLLAVSVGAAGALCIFSAYDIGFHVGRKAGRLEERRKRGRWWNAGGVR